jgi:CheY-like chemotaxis protein
MRVLVVDDDPMAGELTSAILEDLGHETVLAENGVEAAELLGSDTAFDLVLSDQIMPMVTGIDLFRELRSQGVMTPFILLTGSDPQAALTEEPGLDGCLMKDSTLMERLTVALAACMARCQTER